MSKNYIIYRLSSFGDIIHTFSVVDLLKKYDNNIKIHYIVKERYAPLVRLNKNISSICVFKSDDNISKITDYIKQFENSIFVDLHLTVRSLLIKTKLKLFQPSVDIISIKKRNPIKTILIKKHILKLKKTNITLYEKYQKPIQDYLNIADNKVYYPIIENDTVAVDKLIVIAPWSQWQTKDLYDKQIIDTINSISQEYTITLIGTKDKIENSKNIEKQINRNIDNKVGKTSIEDIIEIIKKSSTVISVDSGPLHLALALRKKVVAIFGPTDEKQFEFFDNTLLTNAITCRPCHYYGEKHCHKKHHDCIKKVRYLDI